ncbi:TetR/AcrR family transcriptional regulator [Candidatus Poriferisocius sp.]|uniref:TetR/AcrR family transcriptional regulator n=1 Tax=Candidatus Poriferisocius sp. TaxID=3101276 RepID=UPI003B01362D
MAPASGRSTPLTLEEIVDVSLELVRKHSVQGVTIRAVAAELDVTPMAIYYYVKNKDALVQLISEEVISRAIPLELGDDGWEEALRRYLVSLWTTMHSYRGLRSYRIGLPDLGTSKESNVEGVAFFESAGFPTEIAQRAWAFALTYIHGRLSVEATLDRTTARRLGFGNVSAKDHVDFGVDAVVAGLREMFEQAAA